MTVPQFTQSTGEPRLYWLDDATWAPAGGFGLVSFAQDGTGPATLSLSQSFVDHPGYYVCLATRPAPEAETTFVEAVLALGQRLGAGARFLWLASATPDDDWGRQILYLRQATGASQGLIDRPSVMRIGRYAFSVSAGQTLTPTADGFSINGGAAPAFQLLTDDKTWPMTASAPGASVLSVSGSSAGTFSLDLTLDAIANPDGSGDYALLDVGFRYGLADQTDPASFLLTSLRHPLFRGVASAPVTTTFQLDPVGLLEPTRTRLAYRGAVAAMDTHYTTQLGYGVTLTPVVAASAGLPAGLAFHRRPASVNAAPGDDPLYLAPIGPFTMTIGAPSGAEAQPAARLTGGVSGAEYFGFSATSGVPVSFVPGQPAFAPNFPPPGTSASSTSTTTDGQLTAQATTAFAAVGPPTGGQAWYFAQPDGGAFFHVRAPEDPPSPPAAEDAGDAGDDDALLPYLLLLELVTGDITVPGDAYPLTPYAGGEGNDLTLVRALESQILSPLRRAALGAHEGGLFLRSPSRALDETTLNAVTPQGILANFNDETWNSVVLSPARTGAVLPQMAFNSPNADFRSALQSNQLFLVAANGPLLMTSAGYNYWITDAVLGDLTRLTGAEAVPPSVVTLLSTPTARAPQTSLTAFTALLDTLLTGPNAQYRPIVIKYAVYFELEVEGWRFRLSPSLWGDLTLHPPVMIFKYASGPLYDFVQNTDAWAWPQVAQLDGSTTTTQTLINGVLKAAIDEVALLGQASNLYNFVTDVVADPGWTGVIVLNANVPFSSVPQELSGLAAGVNPDEFRAHHVGISVTPVTIDTVQRDLSQTHSAIFGLIDYQDLEDIAHIDDAFDFKVLLLQVLFVNSAIANFAGRIELFINRLFGEAVTLYNSLHYNNILMEGAYQRQGGSGHYVFGTTEVSRYGADAASRGESSRQTVLLETQFDQVQFVTATLDTATQSTIRNRFLLRGRLRFDALRGFDAFSFGPTNDRNGITIADGFLSFAGLSIDMDFPVATPETRTFTFNLDEVAFDPASSQARTTSFFQRFPLQVAGLIRGDATRKPRDLGYMPLETPLTQPGFSGEWFGLLLAVDLGTLGALSSAPALSASIIAAWSPTRSGHDVNIGLKLPGVESIRALSPIQGVIDLGFQSIDLQADGATKTPPDPAYTLRFRNFYLRFLGWKFPPGQNVITLFGNPDVASQPLASDRGALGWYAAYAKKE